MGGDVRPAERFLKSRIGEARNSFRIGTAEPGSPDPDEKPSPHQVCFTCSSFITDTRGPSMCWRHWRWTRIYQSLCNLLNVLVHPDISKFAGVFSGETLPLQTRFTPPPPPPAPNLLQDSGEESVPGNNRIP